MKWWIFLCQVWFSRGPQMRKEKLVKGLDCLRPFQVLCGLFRWSRDWVWGSGVVWTRKFGPSVAGEMNKSHAMIYYTHTHTHDKNYILQNVDIMSDDEAIRFFTRWDVATLPERRWRSGVECIFDLKTFYTHTHTHTHAYIYIYKYIQYI